MSTTTVGNAPTQPETRPTFRRLRRGQVLLGVLLLALMTIVVLASFGPFSWQLLGQGTLLLAIVVVVLLALGVLLITLVIASITRKRTSILPWLQRLLRLSLVLGILLVALGAAVVGSQWHASTPPILGANGQSMPGSITTLEQVTLNGNQQWITMRGKNRHHPVLLYLNGGPGAGSFPWTPMALGGLEDQFVVVNWDQPNTGKSYGDVPLAQLTPQRYVSDASALTQMLRTRFHQDKIYVLGDSWGSILGIKLVQQHPEWFYAYVGSGQMVNTTGNDVMGYQLALTYAAQHGDTATVDTLRRNGPPPYVGDGMIWKYVAVFNVLNSSMGEIDYRLSVLLVPWLAPEYGLLDRVNYERGLIETYTVLYPQLQNLDFTTQAARLEVPMYFFEGRKDVNAMTSLVEQYYRMLQAPHKELIWSSSGHGIAGADPKQVVDVMVNHVLKQTYHK
jgi:pimeloyl-ACP methyl ester carboxylesterase